MLYLGMRPAPTLRVKPGQVLQRDMSVVLVGNTYYLTRDALTDLVLNPGGFGTNSLRLSPESISMICSVVFVAEIRSLVQMSR